MTRGKGEGSVYKRASDGLWCVRIELPPGPEGKRRQKVVCRKSKPVVLQELKRLQEELLELQEATPGPEPLTLERATEMILAAIQEQRVTTWRGVSRRRIR